MRRQKKQHIPILDLHGKTTDQVFNLIEDFLRKHGHKQKIKIMTGKGSGRLLNKTKQYLKLGSYPWEYEKSFHGQINSGVLIVFLNCLP